MSEPIELIDWDEEENDAIEVPAECAKCAGQIKKEEG